MFSPLYYLGLLSCGMLVAAFVAAALTGALAACLLLYCYRHKLRGPQGAPGRDGRDAEQHTLEVLTELRDKWRQQLADNIG